MPNVAYVGVPEAAEMLGISQQRVRQLLGQPDGLTGHKPGRDWLVSRKSIEARLAKRIPTPTP
jgi:excisionase family DNA binding protein